MGKIITLKDVKSISEKLRTQNKKIVLVGGCFDILHSGHIEFLELSKKAGDALFVEVESDKRIRLLKGSSRPINTQADRAYVLSRLEMIDYIILLPEKLSDEDYLSITKKVQPAILATTKGDPKNVHLYRQAGLLRIEVKEVTPFLQGKSTSATANILGLD